MGGGSVPAARSASIAAPGPRRSQLSADLGVRAAQIASSTGVSLAGIWPPGPASSAVARRRLHRSQRPRS